MHWAEQCRIKHLPTRRYLAVTETSQRYKVHQSLQATQEKLDSAIIIQVTLKSDKLSQSSTVFELFPVIQQYILLRTTHGNLISQLC